MIVNILFFLFTLAIIAFLVIGVQKRKAEIPTEAVDLVDDINDKLKSIEAKIDDEITTSKAKAVDNAKAAATKVKAEVNVKANQNQSKKTIKNK
jgi:ABC-type Na+ efflux pump permease subunit